MLKINSGTTRKSNSEKDHNNYNGEQQLEGEKKNKNRSKKKLWTGSKVVKLKQNFTPL